MDSLTNRIDAELLSFLKEERAGLEHIEPAALPIIDELSRLIDAGGKRLRPRFCYWGFRAAGGRDSDAIVRAAASLELLHTFALIHDDIMDRSSMRRGIEASHLHLGAGHLGLSAAILAGDLSFVLADRMLFDSGFGSNLVEAAFDWFTRMRIEVVAGQYADVAAAGSRAVDERHARRIAALKSGAYTVEKPLAIGAALASASDDFIEQLSAFGRPLGEAFQLRDDVVGTFGSEREIGKDTLSDLREGKATVLVAKARALASEHDREFLDARLGSMDLTESELDRMRSLLRSSGALDATLTLISELHAEAVEALALARVPEDVSSALRSLASEATNSGLG
ncbi:MAG: polyprenyl synthetase family protein [Actinomycetota bacterium]